MNGWVKVCTTGDILENGGSCVKVGDRQIAIFNIDAREAGQEGREWYAVENECPHKRQNVLSRGLVGEDGTEPKIVCPLHKNAFSLKTGKHLGGNDSWILKTYPVKIENGDIYLLERSLLNGI